MKAKAKAEVRVSRVKVIKNKERRKLTKSNQKAKTANQVKRRIQKTIKMLSPRTNLSPRNRKKLERKKERLIDHFSIKFYIFYHLLAS